jgi:hypothetical protein
MLLEIRRHNWREFRAQPTAVNVPSALETLARTTSQNEAEKAYWQIDNVVVVQGMLFDAAVPVISCLLSVLQICSDVARPFVMELLVQIGSGEPAPSEIEVGNVHLSEICLRELCHGTAIYFDILENGTSDEQLHAVDLLGLCASYDKSLKPRVIWWLNWLLSQELKEHFRNLVQNLLTELAGGEKGGIA